jgi:hypothetical protein
LKTQIEVINGLEAEGLHRGLDESMKVHYFMEAIKDSNPMMSNIYMQILAMPEYLENLTACIDLAQDTLKLKSGVGHQSTINLSSVKVQPESQQVEPRYYCRKEWNRLTSEQKKAVIKLRGKGNRNQKAKGKDNQGSSVNKSKKPSRATKRFKNMKRRVRTHL